MRRKLLSALLAVIMVLALVPVGSFAAAINYDLWIAGVRVTSDNLSGNGWSYNPTTKTLTLNNFTYSGVAPSYSIDEVNPLYSIGGTEYQYLILSGIEGLTVTGNAEIKLDCPSDGDDDDALIFFGDVNFVNADITMNTKVDDVIDVNNGKITITNCIFDFISDSDGIISDEGIIITDSTINLVVDTDGLDAGDYVKISNSTVQIFSDDNGVEAYGDVEINNSTIKIKTTDTVGYGDGIETSGSVTISDSDITIKAEYDGIDALGILLIDGSTVDIESNSNGIDTIDDVTINNSTINIVALDEESSSDGIDVGEFGDVTLNDSDVTIEAEDDGIDTSGDVIINGGNIKISTLDDDGVEARRIEIIDGTINIDADSCGLYAAKDVTITGGDIIIVSEHYGICSDNDIIILKGGNWDIKAEDGAMNVKPDASEYKGEFNPDDYNKPELVAKTESNDEKEFLPLYVLGAFLAMSEEHTITAEADDNGSITPEGEVKVRVGLSKTFTIKADKGYVIDSVIVDGEDIGAVEKYTFANVTEDHTISVTFIEEPWKSPYTDVDADDEFYADVEYVTVNGLIDGASNRRFAPKADADLIDVLTALYRLAGSPEVLADDEEDAVLIWAVASKLIESADDFDENGDITYAEAIAMLMAFADAAELPATLVATAKTMLGALGLDMTADVTRADVAMCLRLLGEMVG